MSCHDCEKENNNIISPCEGDSAEAVKQPAPGQVKNNSTSQQLDELTKKGKKSCLTIIFCLILLAALLVLLPKLQNISLGGGENIFTEGIAVVEKDGKYGYAGSKGERITDTVFDDAFDFHNGFGIVMINGKYGYVNKKGKLVIPAEFDDAFEFNSKKLAVVQKEGKFFIIDSKGKVKVMLNEPEEINYVADDGIIFTVQGKQGVMDYKGKIIIPPLYDEIY